MNDFVVVALSSKTKVIRVYSGFSSEDDAVEFVEADQFDPEFDTLAVTRSVHVERVAEDA